MQEIGYRKGKILRDKGQVCLTTLIFKFGMANVLGAVWGYSYKVIIYAS